jgi:hypothetical protein
MPKIRWTLDQNEHYVIAWRSSDFAREQYCDLYDIPFIWRTNEAVMCYFHV